MVLPNSFPLRWGMSITTSQRRRSPGGATGPLIAGTSLEYQGA
jgi:hypothetical protein